MSFSALFALWLVAVPSPQQGSTSPAADAPTKPQPAATATQSTDELPVSLRRIRRALARPPSLKLYQPTLRDGRPVFRVDIEAERIDIEDILGKDYLRGVASYGGMTHQEFLDMVTPKDVQGYAAFSNTEGLVVAATSIALKWAALKALDAFKKAKSEREREAAREEVREALDALRKARRAAGLPDK
jgi:hypothetical protein